MRGRDLNQIQTWAQGQWDPDRAGTAVGEGQEGCLAGWDWPARGGTLVAWFLIWDKWKILGGLMIWNEKSLVICSCFEPYLFSNHVFPAMASKAIPWAEVKWIWAPKIAKAPPDLIKPRGVLAWRLPKVLNKFPKLRSVWVLLSTVSQHWSTSSSFVGGR